MSTKIYLFKTHPVNISNLALAQFIENSIGKSYGACRYTLKENKFFEQIAGAVAKSQTKDPITGFRTINWNDPTNLNTLIQMVDLAQDKFLIIGSSLNEQITFLKTQFKPNIVTISVNYKESYYQQLLKNMAEYHVYLLKNNPITASTVDQELLLAHSTNQLINYYMLAFDQNNLIPKSNQYFGDYNIDIEDFFNKSKMTDHFSNLNMPFTIDSVNYYDTWLLGQSM
jgi:hypothetical protein